jgi:hypothetical protein
MRDAVIFMISHYGVVTRSVHVCEPIGPVLRTGVMTPNTIDHRRAATRAVHPLPLFVLAATGGGVAIALGVYGRVHAPTGGRIFNFGVGVPSLRALKSGLSTIAVALIVVQIGSALAMFGRLPFLRTTPRWLAPLHRWSGTVAFVVSLPVAYHCLWALGLRSSETRPLLHGLFGCAFYGAMTTKLLALRSERLPRWAVPVIGSLLVVTLTAAWLTSVLWFYTGFDITRLF